MPNPHRGIELLASILEISGTFFLSVEAITLQKLKALKQGLFARVVHLLTPKASVPESATEEDIANVKEKVLNRTFAILALVGVAFLYALLRARRGTLPGVWHVLLSIVPSPSWLSISFAVCIGISGLLGFSLFTGYILYWLVLFPFKFSYSFLQWIETHTQSGAIGILGFLMFLVGTLIHAYFSWIGP
jgi:hypothetical protein